MEQGVIPSVPLLSGWWRSIKAGIHSLHRSPQQGQLPTGRRQQIHGEADHQVLVGGHTLGNQQGERRQCTGVELVRDVLLGEVEQEQKCPDALVAVAERVILDHRLSWDTSPVLEDGF